MATAVESGRGQAGGGEGCAVTVAALVGGTVAVLVFFWLCGLYVDACDRM